MIDILNVALDANLVIKVVMQDDRHAPFIAEVERIEQVGDETVVTFKRTIDTQAFPGDEPETRSPSYATPIASIRAVGPAYGLGPEGPSTL
jgi:hypothetical protein